MAKGDQVTVVTTAGEQITLTALRIGRRLEVRKGPKWLEVRELTRGGRPTGNGTVAALAAVAAYTTTVRED